MYGKSAVDRSLRDGLAAHDQIAQDSLTRQVIERQCRPDHIVVYRLMYQQDPADDVINRALELVKPSYMHREYAIRCLQLAANNRLDKSSARSLANWAAHLKTPAGTLNRHNFELRRNFALLWAYAISEAEIVLRGAGLTN